MLFQRLSAVLALAGAIHALSIPSSHVQHEKRTTSMKRWVKRHALPSEDILPMRIGLRQPRIEDGYGHTLLEQVSDPSSSQYGKYFTAQEVTDIFAPSEASVQTVREWLEASGIHSSRISQTTNKQWIAFDARVDEAEALFKTKYSLYEHTHSGNLHVACDEYHMPEHVSKLVDYITPGVKLYNGGRGSTRRALEVRKRDLAKRGFRTDSNSTFSSPKFGAPVTVPVSTLNITALELSMCDQYVTPQCIFAMYNITKPTKAIEGNELGIFEEGDYYAPEDLALFFATFAPQIPLTTEPILKGIDGGIAPLPYAGGESDLDFQITYPIIWPQNSVLFQTDDPFNAIGLGGEGFLNTFLDAIDGSYCTSCAYGECGNADIDPKYPNPIPAGYQGQLMCGTYKPANVISISYGEQEDDIPTNYQQRQCAEFMKLGLQGVTVVIASGDSGVAARSSDDGNDDGCLGNGEVFNPDFPASCPYITAAGATYLPTGGNVYKDEEVAVTRFPSGGGFSNIYPRPAYQNAAVNTYVTKHTPAYKTYNTSGTNNPSENITAGGIYNIGGRGYPDIGAVGDNVIIFVNGAPTLIGGTSASSPVFAALLNRINEERISAGKSTVGFVNPTLYKHPEMFHDITVGTNPGCNTEGFRAAAGWDPLTGLGTPNYPAMLKVFMALP